MHGEISPKTDVLFVAARRLQNIAPHGQMVRLREFLVAPLISATAANVIAMSSVLRSAEGILSSAECDQEGLSVFSIQW